MDAVEDVGARSFVNRRTKKREYFECLVSAAIVPSLRTGVGMCGDRELERFTLRGNLPTVVGKKRALACDWAGLVGHVS